MNIRKYAIVCMVLMLVWNFCSQRAMAQIDTMAYSLDTLTVSAKYYSSHLKGNANKTIRWDMDMMHDLPKILGNADPVHYAQFLPGVQTCSEYNSGLYIQGCDNAHNLISIENVPIYNASHLLGFFSVFNASHFPQMSFSKTTQSASVSNHLGGVLNMQLPDSLITRTTGEYVIGPMSSQGSLRLPVSKKSALFVSLRAAYLNLLYGKWLKMDDNQLEYDFSDYNLTYLFVPNVRNQIKADVYIGFDNVGFDESSYHARNQLKWHNEKVSLSWKHYLHEDMHWNQTIYFTSYRNRFYLKQANLEFSLPSSIADLGYKGVFRNRKLQVGADVIYHNLQPQNPQIEGSYNALVMSQPKQKAWETALFVDYENNFSLEWAMKTGMRLTYYSGNNIQHTSADPMLSLSYSNPLIGNWNLNFRMQHQYLFQSGFTSMGFPTEFWFTAGKEFKPQSSKSVSLTYDIPLFQGRYGLFIEGYYKRLYNQVEYKGTVFDFLNSVYSLSNSLLNGDGENYGINVMLNKKTGNLTGWISYTWGRALRHFETEDSSRKYPANHERIHELNATATWKLGSKWSVGTTAVYASGTPFTAPKYIYMFGNQIMAEYGEHNASRLNPYFRMDLSVNYNLIKKKQREFGVNLSLYNVTSHANDLYHRFSFNKENESYVYKPVRFIMKLLPSVNVYHKF